jgi:hypothetical protein
MYSSIIDSPLAAVSQVDNGYGPFPALVNFSMLDRRAGLKIIGQHAGDLTGSSVSGVGDVSGDGVDDLCLTAVGSSAKAFCVFGRGIKAGQNTTLQLSGLRAGSGIIIVGASSEGVFRSVAFGGDVNGDGRKDIIIGAPHASNVCGIQAGEPSFCEPFVLPFTSSLFLGKGRF